MLTLSPRASRIAPREADAMPLPSEETTPPVTKTNRVIGTAAQIQSRARKTHAIAIAQKEFEIRREFRLPDRPARHNRDALQWSREMGAGSGERRSVLPHATESRSALPDAPAR